MQQRPAIGFLARSIAEHFKRQGLLCILKLKVPIELPHVGLITLRGRAKTPAGQLLVDSLRETAARYSWRAAFSLGPAAAVAFTMRINPESFSVRALAKLRNAGVKCV